MLQLHQDSRFDDLRALIEKGITVSHISSSFQSVDHNTNPLELKKQLYKKDFDLIGIKKDDDVIGFVQQEDLSEGSCEDFLKHFKTQDIVSESTPLLNAIYLFENRERIFVLQKNELKGIISKADLQKPPARMLLFGLITLLESFITELIRKHYSNEQWYHFISEERLKSAKEKYQEKADNNVALDLLDYLYLVDKLKIILNIDEVSESFVVTSRKKIKSSFNDINVLRNTLAHAREISLESMISTTREIEDLLQKSHSLLYS